MDAPVANRDPIHLVQRSRLGEACFRDVPDCLAYLRALADCATRLEAAVHAYALMGNHVHLLVTPGRTGADRLLHGLAVRHELEPQDDEGYDPGEAPRMLRRDSLTPIRARRHLLACMRYIELNPVRAGLVRAPADWRWSSHRANALGQEDALVAPHPVYYALGRTPGERQASYRELFTPRRAIRVARDAARVLYRIGLPSGAAT
jgi:putative transposase